VAVKDRANGSRARSASAQPQPDPSMRAIASSSSGFGRLGRNDGPGLSSPAGREAAHAVATGAVTPVYTLGGHRAWCRIQPGRLPASRWRPSARRGTSPDYSKSRDLSRPWPSPSPRVALRDCGLIASVTLLLMNDVRVASPRERNSWPRRRRGGCILESTRRCRACGLRAFAGADRARTPVSVL
jgi:hypothetical protein